MCVQLKRTKVSMAENKYGGLLMSDRTWHWLNLDDEKFQLSTTQVHVAWFELLSGLMSRIVDYYKE